MNRERRGYESEEIMGKYISLNKLSEIVKQSCAMQNITQERLCELTDINRNIIGRIKRNGYIPSVSQLEKLAEVLNFKIRDLFIEANNPIVFTSLHASGLTIDAESHLMEMMLVARQQIMLRRALYDR
ncbi:helix-turn-helix transcriptional regulator [Lacrimispora indolis]|uniref:helix-turn-helix transcriptional regulator n=1 Tax=Lacrimispora indolis TaxID=69825 RepID=UPI003566E9EF